MLYLQPYDVEKMAFFFRTLLLVTTPHNDPPRDTDTQCTHQPTTLHSKHHLLTQWGDQVAWVTSAQAIMVAAEFVCCLRKKKKLKNSAPKPFLRTWLQLRTRVKQAEDGFFFSVTHNRPQFCYNNLKMWLQIPHRPFCEPHSEAEQI